MVKLLMLLMMLCVACGCGSKTERGVVTAKVVGKESVGGSFLGPPAAYVIRTEDNSFHTYQAMYLGVVVGKRYRIYWFKAAAGNYFTRRIVRLPDEEKEKRCESCGRLF